MIDVNYHSSIRISNIYIDPFNIKDNRGDAKYIFITHSHYDHLSISDIDKVINSETIIVGCEDVISEVSKRYDNKVILVNNNFKYSDEEISFYTFPSYNINKKFHPFSNGWVGYVIEFNKVRYCVIRDSDLTKEVKKIKCDILFVPIGGVYTMGAKEASELANIIRPKLVVPVHYNAIVGTKEDEKTFIKNLNNIEYKVFL